jgi:hypothetical protein
MPLSPSQFAALQEIGSSSVHAAIPAADAARLLELKLAYRLLGEIRITTEGRKRLAGGI